MADVDFRSGIYLSKLLFMFSDRAVSNKPDLRAYTDIFLVCLRRLLFLGKYLLLFFFFKCIAVVCA